MVWPAMRGRRGCDVRVGVVATAPPEIVMPMGCYTEYACGAGGGCPTAMPPMGNGNPCSMDLLDSVMEHLEAPRSRGAIGAVGASAPRREVPPHLRGRRRALGLGRHCVGRCSSDSRAHSLRNPEPALQGLFC